MVVDPPVVTPTSTVVQSPTGNDLLVRTLQIAWHHRDHCEPVLSLDFHPSRPLMATGGSDNAIRIWNIVVEESKIGPFPTAKFEVELQRHDQNVNAVRFSPNGELLASCADDQTVIIWKVADWQCLGIMRGHLGDVYDVSWSHDSRFLISGSIDNKSIIWSLESGKDVLHLTEAQHYIQGVSWDPLSEYACTYGCDRTCRVYSVPRNPSAVGRGKENEFKCKVVIRKIDDSAWLFRDETAGTFFRRLCWSPEGSLLVVPCGQTTKKEEGGQFKNCCYVFARRDITQGTKQAVPILCLEGFKKPTVAVRFHPRLFRLQSTDTSSVIDLPYRMIYAVASGDAVLIYDTSVAHPIAQISDVHYSTLTDIGWSADGHLLSISSRDGYVTFASFASGAFGEPLLAEEQRDIIEKLRVRVNEIHTAPPPTKPRSHKKKPQPPKEGEEKLEDEPKELDKEKEKEKETSTSIAESAPVAAAEEDKSKIAPPPPKREGADIAKMFMKSAAKTKRPQPESEASSSSSTVPVDSSSAVPVAASTDPVVVPQDLTTTATTATDDKSEVAAAIPPPEKKKKKITPIMVSAPAVSVPVQPSQPPPSSSS